MNTEFPEHLIAIHGAPRSGTTWLGQLFNAHESVAYRYQPFFSHALRGRVSEASQQGEWQAFFRQLAQTTDDFVLQRGEAKLARSQPYFSKATSTHLVYKEVRFHHLLPALLRQMPTLRLVAIVRDPRDVIASWLAAPREFKPEWDVLDEWRGAPSKNVGQEENWYGFERWMELTRLFLHLREHYPQRVRLVRYEELTAAPRQILDELFEFCSLPMTAQVEQFIQASTSRDDGEVYGVFRAHDRLGSQRRALPAQIAREISAQLEGTPFATFLRADC